MLFDANLDAAGGVKQGEGTLLGFITHNDAILKRSRPLLRICSLLSFS